MISEDGSGNPVFIVLDQTAFPPVSSLIKLTDHGSSYTFNYAHTLNEGSEVPSVLLVDTVSQVAYTASYDNSVFPYKRSVYKNHLQFGQQLWKDSVYDGQHIFDLQLNGNNDLVAAGGGTDYHVWYYNASGTAVTYYHYDGPCGGNDAVSAFAFTNDNKIVVTGSSCENSSANNNYATTLKYVNPNTSTGINEIQDGVSVHVYPVPANDILNIETTSVVYHAEMTDVIGRTVAVDIIHNTIDVSIFSTGIYQLRVNTPDGMISKNVLIVR